MFRVWRMVSQRPRPLMARSPPFWALQGRFRHAFASSGKFRLFHKFLRLAWRQGYRFGAQLRRNRARLPPVAIGLPIPQKHY